MSAAATPIKESESSLAARNLAEMLGQILGSSYTMVADKPTVWAFDLEMDLNGQRLIVAGSEKLNGRIFIFAEADNSAPLMLYAKELVANSGAQPLTTNTIIEFDKTPEGTNLYCDSVYISEIKIKGMQEHDVLAVFLHASDVGFSPDQTAEIISKRTPDFISTFDRKSQDPHYSNWVRIIRIMRRIDELKKISGPPMIIENDTRMLMEAWDALGSKPLTPWPNDLKKIVIELRL